MEKDAEGADGTNGSQGTTGTDIPHGMARRQDRLLATPDTHHAHLNQESHPAPELTAPPDVT